MMWAWARQNPAPPTPLANRRSTLLSLAPPHPLQVAHAEFLELTTKRGKMQKRADSKALVRAQAKTGFVFTVPLAITGITIGAGKLVKTTYDRVQAERLRDKYARSVAEYIIHLDHPPTRTADGLKETEAIMFQLAQAYTNCLTLRGLIGPAFMEVRRKRQVIQTALEKEHVEKSSTTTEDKLDFFHHAAHAGATAMEAAGTLVADAGGELAAVAVLASVQTLMGAFNMNQAEMISAQGKNKNEWWTTQVSRAANVVGVTASIVGACFDPTGLSMAGLALSIVGSGAEESAAWRERQLWSNYYCPALDAAFVQVGKIGADSGAVDAAGNKYHYGPGTSVCHCCHTPRACVHTVPQVPRRSASRLLTPIPVPRLLVMRGVHGRGYLRRAHALPPPSHARSPPRPDPPPRPTPPRPDRRRQGQHPLQPDRPVAEA